MSSAYFLTHPDVVLDKSIPVTRWPLSEVGKKKAAKFTELTGTINLKEIYSSPETKAIETAQLISAKIGVEIKILPELGEVDRSSTGFLDPPEHEKAVEALFSYPLESYKGWETALEAQRRIIDAWELILKQQSGGDILIVSHGAVGAFLYAFLSNLPISRQTEQKSMGSFFVINTETKKVISGWNQL